MGGGEVCFGNKIIINQRTKLQGTGKIIIEDNCMLGYGLGPDYYYNCILLQARNSESIIKLGKNTSINNNVSIISCDSVTIGANVRIGNRVMIIDSDFHDLNPDKRSDPGISKPIIIHDNVFIGANAMILKGVSIGQNSVLGAGSVLTAPIPENVVAAGNPAKVIKQL